tara:strand:- start:71 stop:676 length:606 start_codon:yes stop_codon:yes gene_type:complete
LSQVITGRDVGDEHIEKRFFIEIGTCDFDTLENLAQQGWKGIFVEPIEEYLDKLERFDGCIYENCAVLDTIDTMPIQFYDPNWAEGWKKGVGSLDLGHNNFIANPQFEEHVVSREVSVVTLDYLIKKHNVTRIDYLKIDIEGWDYKILDDYSWDIKPKKLVVEHKHWENRQVSVNIYLTLLETMGYECSMDKENITAVLNE